MPLINCPKCGMPISDQAEKCVHCGHSLKKEEPVFQCPECYASIDINVDICPNCGHPLKNLLEEPYDEKDKKRVRKNIMLCVLTFSLIIASVSGTVLLKNHKKTLQNNYEKNASKIIATMISSGRLAEECANQVKSVIEASTLEVSSAKTNMYTKPNGKYVSTKKAVSNLFDDTVFNIDLNSIEAAQDKVDKLYEKLKYPPKNLEDVHENIEDFYEIFNDFTNTLLTAEDNTDDFIKEMKELDAKLAEEVTDLEDFILMNLDLNDID